MGVIGKIEDPNVKHLVIIMACMLEQLGGDVQITSEQYDAMVERKRSIGTKTDEQQNIHMILVDGVQEN